MYKNHVEMRLPLEGEWFVVAGGYNKSKSHSWHTRNQRYAYDFTKVDSLGNHYKGSKFKLENYYAYKQKVIAPGDGRVVLMRKNIEDIHMDCRKIKSYRTSLGKYLTIKHGDNIYSTLAHLKKDSILCNIGDKVRAGELLGFVGNSGNSAYPHLHFQVQNKETLFLSKSLPIYFTNTYVKFENIRLIRNKISKNMVVGSIR